MQCFRCGKTPDEAGALYRTNPKGQPGIWACEEHMPDPGTIDTEVKNLVDIIQEYNKE